MKKHLSFFVPVLVTFLLIGCQKNTLDVATAEKIVRDFNAKFQQQPDQTLVQNASGDYVFINGEGGFVTKEQLVEMAKSLKVAKWDLDNLKVRAFDNVLVATGVNNHAMVGNDGKTATYQTAFTYIYHVKGGKLEVVSMHHSHVQNAMNE